MSRVVAASVDAGIGLERRAVGFVLERPELDRAVAAAVDDPRVHAALRQAFDSEGAARVVDAFFDSRLFDRVVDRLLHSDGIWTLIDEIAASPAVTAAISHQGLSFADQVGDEVRLRSRTADDWLEQAARRIARRRDRRPAAEPDRATP